SEAPLVDCPACAQPTLKKKISAAGFRLSGSGWYETDYKSGKEKHLARDAGSASRASDAKPAAATPANTRPAVLPQPYQRLSRQQENAMRSEYCGALNASFIDQEVTLCGWVDRRRDHGGVIFIDLRDRDGIVQVVFDPDGKENFALADKVRGEYVLQ